MTDRQAKVTTIQRAVDVAFNKLDYAINADRKRMHAKWAVAYLRHGDITLYRLRTRKNARLCAQDRRTSFRSARVYRRQFSVYLRAK